MPKRKKKSRKLPKLPKPQTFRTKLREAGATKEEIAHFHRALELSRERIARYKLVGGRWKSMGSKPTTRTRPRRYDAKSRKWKKDKSTLRFYDRRHRKWVSEKEAMTIMKRSRYDRTIREIMRRKRCSYAAARRHYSKLMESKGRRWIITRYTSP